MPAPKSRAGKGLFPPNPNQWSNERNALALRDALGLGPRDALPHDEAFARLPGVEVFAHGDVPAAAVFIEQLRNAGRTWSGVTCPLSDGAIVIYNDAHPLTRVRATLMEEYFHIKLGHPPSVLKLHAPQARTHDAAVESEAYGSGAAALVPFAGLRLLIDEDRANGREIADVFEVSPELVVFRAKVTKLYKKLRDN